MDQPKFSDFREDGDLPFAMGDRASFDGRGFDDPLGGYGPDEPVGAEYDDEYDDYGQDEYDDYAPEDEGEEAEGEWMEPEQGEYDDYGQAPPAAEQRPAPVKAELAWETRTMTLLVEGSMNQFHKDPSLAQVQVGEEFKGSFQLKEMRDTKDFLGGIRVVKGRNALPVTIGVKAELLDGKGRDKICGKLIAKGQTGTLSFDLYPKAQIKPHSAEVILARPTSVRKPILAAYKNDPKVELRKYAEPSRLWEGIANNPSSEVTKYVSSSHPVMVQMVRDARRRCAYLGKPYDHRAEFGTPHGGNYAIDDADVKKQIKRLRDDFHRVNYVSDLPRLSLALVRTQLTEASAHRNKLRTNWRDRSEVGADLPATDDGDAELERRLNAVHKTYLTIEYDYLPHDKVDSS